MNGNLIAGGGGGGNPHHNEDTLVIDLEDCADICLTGPGSYSKAYSEDKLSAVFH